MSKREHIPSEKRVFVVETWLRQHRRWVPWSAYTQRYHAWGVARDARKSYPKERFRTVIYSRKRT